MKNEFYFKRIMFCDVKKRYLSLAYLQEGQELFDRENNMRGLPEIKGFDFKKAGVKPFVNQFYTDLAKEDILRAEKIDPVAIFKKFMGFKKYMEEEIKKGNMDFFKQANVKRPEHYKNPFSTQGVSAIMLWNALMEEKAIEFPNDVNIVPIKDITWDLPKEIKNDMIQNVTDPLNGAVRTFEVHPYDKNKFLDNYRKEYPEGYRRLYSNIYTNFNPLVRFMSLKAIAIPKNLDYTLPEYVTALFDVDTVINNALSLGLPILNTLGIHSFKVSAETEYVSNMIPL